MAMLHNTSMMMLMIITNHEWLLLFAERLLHLSASLLVVGGEKWQCCTITSMMTLLIMANDDWLLPTCCWTCPVVTERLEKQLHVRRPPPACALCACNNKRICGGHPRPVHYARPKKTCAFAEGSPGLSATSPVYSAMRSADSRKP